MIISGEKVSYDGEIFKLQRGFKLLFDMPVRRSPEKTSATSSRTQRGGSILGAMMAVGG